jgi:uncharacterized protein
MKTAPAAPRSKDWRGIHGIVFLAMFGLANLTPLARSWPWFWLLPLIGYYVLVAVTPALRHTIGPPRAGSLTFRNVAFALSIAVLSMAALACYQWFMHPDLGELAGLLPVRALGGPVLAGVVFSLVNATLEELIFRGILFDAIDADWGQWAALGLTAVLFGYGHLTGYPPGWPGACLATAYAILLGLLRIASGGLLLPSAAHVVADATIYVILIND